MTPTEIVMVPLNTLRYKVLVFLLQIIRTYLRT